jgi:protein TonB
MPLYTDRPDSAYGQAMSLRRRLTSFVIALLINALLLLMLLFLSPTLPGSKTGDGRLLTFNVNDSKDDKSAAKSRQPKAAQAKSATTTTKAAPKPSVTPPVIPPTTKQPNMILLNHDEFAASDISKLPSHAGELASAGGAGEPGDTGLAGGSGPHGEPLYNAEWYRRPTDAELDTYVGKYRPPDGSWGEIACQTMPRFHVDNCVALADSPPGSHLARALQEAGWQFLVRPPRVGGKSLIGSWVRIHIEFTRTPKAGLDGN